jgi:hypothetical protein
MIKVRNVTSKTLVLNSIIVQPGETKIVPGGGVVSYAFARGKIEIIKDNARLHEKSYLEKLPMDELRKIGDPLGAKDTKKSELISEILNMESENYG